MSNFLFKLDTSKGQPDSQNITQSAATSISLSEKGNFYSKAHREALKKCGTIIVKQN